MAKWSRIKCMLGGHGELETLASAATINVPDESNAFYLSGTTTITSILVGNKALRNRQITFIGAAGAAVTFTNTNTPTTAGQMELRGANRLLEADGSIDLFIKNDGTLILRNLV
jgi:hypothetical protein